MGAGREPGIASAAGAGHVRRLRAPGTEPATPVSPKAMAPCHSAVKDPPMRPLLPMITDSTNTTIAAAAPGRIANRHGFARAQRLAPPHCDRSSAPPPATAKKATAPADSELVRPRWPPVRCRTRSAPATTAPAAPAVLHGATDIALLDAASSSRRLSPGSWLRGGADIVSPWVAGCCTLN